MKNITFLISLVALGCLAMGCASLLGTNAAPQSIPVVYGNASTNDPNLVAWLKMAQTANATVNPTSSEKPLDAIIGGLIALAASVATSYQHRQNVQQAATIATASTRPPAGIKPPTA
jgi:uncharacterized protein YceK